MKRDEVETLSFSARRAQSRGRPDQQERPVPKHEVIVTFENVDDRDQVRMRARNLQGDKDAGMDIVVPDHLRADHRTLQSLAYRMKQKHPRLKRNLLFDDMEMCIKMNFLTDGKSWKTVFPTAARASLKDKKKKNADTLGEKEISGLMPTDSSDTDTE